MSGQEMAFERMLSAALQEALRFTKWSRFDPKYVDAFKAAWRRHAGTGDTIGVDAAFSFAKELATKGHSDWELSGKDKEVLERFRASGGIPLMAFARFSEDDDFDPTPFLSAARPAEITIGNSPPTTKGGPWTLYVNDPSESVSSVVFKLPKNYRPSVVTVARPPFKVSNAGAGEFRATVLVVGKSGDEYEFTHMLNLRQTSEQSHKLHRASAGHGPVAESSAHGEWLTQGGGKEFATQKATKEAKVRVVDWRLSGPERARQLVEGLKSSGFVYIVNHAVPESVEKAAFRESRAFFLKQQPEKDALRSFDPIPQIKCNIGYIPSMEERLNPSTDPDQKETFDFGNTGPDGIGKNDKQLRANIWPNDPVNLPDFKEACLNYQYQMRKLGEEVLSAVAEGLGVRELLDAFDQPIVITRLIRYMEKSSIEPGGSGLGAGSHVDYGALTLIHEDAPGLEVYQGGWATLPRIPGSVILNTGYIMEKLTNGLFPATKHRVVNNNPGFRHSIATFYDANPKAHIAPLNAFTAGKLGKYKPCVAGLKGILVNKKSDPTGGPVY